MNRLPHAGSFSAYTARMSGEDKARVKQALHALIDEHLGKDKILVSSFIPGRHWEGTPWEPIYVSCGRNFDAARKCFGQFVWEVFREREDEWFFMKEDFTGREETGTTYFPRRTP